MRALITGVNSLVNEELLDKLVDMGFEVTAHYHSENEITARLKSKYKKVTYVQADFSTKDGFFETREWNNWWRDVRCASKCSSLLRRSR